MTDEELSDTINALSDIVSAAFDSSEEDDERREALTASMTAMDEFAATHRNAELYFRCGSNWSLHPDCRSSVDVQARARRWLVAALELDASHEWARLHLGMCEYEAGAFDSAVQHLSLINTAGRTGFVVVRTHELLLCCAMRATSPVECAEQLRKYGEICSQNTWSDVVHLTLTPLLTHWVEVHSRASLEPIRRELEALNRAEDTNWSRGFLERRGR